MRYFAEGFNSKVLIMIVTAYMNLYLVVSPNGKYTKHYYAGSQRIVSKLGDIESFGADPRRIEYAGSSVPGVTINWKAKYQRSIEDLKGNYAYFEVPYNGKDNDDYVNGEGFCCSQNTALRVGIGIGNVNYEKMQYYYHPDHLGSSSYITNLDGEIVQHVEYVPFGEVFIEERNNSWNTPYLFNGKKLDEETGLYYYGARYYNPRESVWLSVDPLAELAPNMSPYRYAFNNPTNFIDPYGLFETRKEARQYRREHGIDGKIHKAKDGTFSIDDYRNSVSYSRSLDTNEVEQAILVAGNKKSNGNSTLNTIGQVNDIFDNLGGSLANNSGKTRLGTNGKLYFETVKGRVFYGNQYVSTSPLLKYGKGITKVTGPIGHMINAGQIAYGMSQDNWTYGHNAKVATAGVAGGIAGTWAGATAGAKIGASVGVWFGGIGSVPGAIIGGFFGGLAGGFIGSELTEVVVEESLK